MTAQTASDRFTSVTATAGQTVLAWDFELTEAAGLTVVRIRDAVAVTLTPGDDYSFPAGLGTAAGGTLTLAAAALDGDVYQLIGQLAETRQSDFLATQAFKSAKFNADLDRLTLTAQEHRRDIDRAWKSDYGTEGGRIEMLAEGHFHKADADGNLVDGGSAEDIANAQANAAAVAADKLTVEGYKDEAAASATAAAQSAASLNLPAIETGKFIVGNAGADGYDKKVLGATGELMAAAATRRAAREIIVGDTFVNFKNEFSATSDGSTDVSALFNEALGDGESSGDGVNAVPYGAILAIEDGTYKITSPILQKRVANVMFTGDARIRLDSDNIAHDAVQITIDPALKGSLVNSRGLFWEGPGNILINSGFDGGRYAVNFGQDTTDAQFQWRFSGLRLTSRGDQGCAFHATGFDPVTFSGPTFCTLEHCVLSGGVFLDNVADGWRILNNQIFGNQTGVKLDIVEGAYCTVIQNNAITSRDGALDVINGAQWLFMNNQCEQGAGLTNTNTIGGVTAQVIVRGVDRVINGGTLFHNNFGGGIGRVDMNVIIDNAENIWMDRNRYYSGSAYIDVRLTANAKWCVVDENPLLRGTRSTTNGYSSDPDKKFRVQDLGVGNSVPWKGVAALGFDNSWANNIASYYRRDPSGRVYFSGSLKPGTITAGTQITTLPEGYRPASTQQVVTTCNGEIAILNIGPSGAITVTAISSGASSSTPLYLNGVSFHAQARNAYGGEN